MSIFGIRGVHVPHHKHTEKLAAVRMPIPKTVVIPMSMHIGAPAKPIVNVGDTVGVGQLIAEAGGFISSPVHASVSGTVKKERISDWDDYDYALTIRGDFVHDQFRNTVIRFLKKVVKAK